MFEFFNFQLDLWKTRALLLSKYIFIIVTELRELIFELEWNELGSTGL